MTALLLTVFVASVVGSLHCIGMCGPFVAFYSGADGSGGARRLFSHAAYSGGRLLTYAVFGIAAGAVGAALDVAGSLAGFQRIAAIIAGVTMILWGVFALLQIRGVRIFKHGSGKGRIAGVLASRILPGQRQTSGRSRRCCRSPVRVSSVRLALGLRGHRRGHRQRTEGCGGDDRLLGRDGPRPAGSRSRSTAGERTATAPRAGRDRAVAGRARVSTPSSAARPRSAPPSQAPEHAAVRGPLARGRSRILLRR